ncbi:SDR family NAD(P)-dependent oxidoreductase [Deinococcus koreensis]|uniref:Short-chain dehydrogenase n=1 Tax=Deinococcus koreensis TaxID=2054903 RepID=A0A2K3UWY0_9DEIO|nr:SDR family oxidoreductase [Deinococcus koreensis]PNY81039.1 short-chain dehydrogenase [Deinococcus koreensis]
MDLGLSGKVAVVTGGSVGIGRAVARGLAAEGVHLALCARNQERLSGVADEIRQAFGVRVLGVAADVSVAADLERFVEAVGAEYGGADLLINNAGTGSEETILGAPDEKWQHYWELHVMAAVRLSRALAPGMAARGGGVILNNASICASQPLGYEPIYNVTKAALVMFSKCLANELIAQGIRVNALSPGLVMTPDWQKTARLLTEGKEQTWEAYLENIAHENAPIGRFAIPEEIADFAVFLCSPRASYSVGSTYYVDGGWLNVTT